VHRGDQAIDAQPHLSTLDSFILAASAQPVQFTRRLLGDQRSEFQMIDKSSGRGVESAWIKIARQQATLMASLAIVSGSIRKVRRRSRLPAANKESKFEGLSASTRLRRT